MASMRKPNEPLYEKVRDALAADLANSTYPPGTALPNERELAAHHGVSIGTLRTAVNSLVNDGMLIRQQGRGTFVAHHDRDRLRFYFYHVVEHGKTKEHYPDVGLVGFTKERADAEVAAALRLDRGAMVYHLRNRVGLAGTVVNVDDIWLCAKRFAGLEEAAIRDRHSTLYQLYQAQFNLTVVRTSERLRATPCSAAHAALLNVTEGASVLQIRRLAFAYDGTPIEWRISTVNTEHHEYASELVE
jgi:GntR family transcriptional regulator